jgi:hypothetical protein
VTDLAPEIDVTTAEGGRAWFEVLLQMEKRGHEQA